MTGMAESKKLGVVLVVVTGCMYIVCSAGLIAFNKHLMAEGVFPFVCALNLTQMIFCSIMSLLLYSVMPSLFSSMTDPEKKVSLDFDTTGVLLKGIVPIACLQAVQLILTNQSYLYADIGFLQMIKESNVIAVYLMSIAFAIEVFRWRQLRIIFLLVVATCMSIKGDSRFSSMGLSLTISCFFFESLKITLQGLVLSGKGKGLDCLSYVLLVSPVCALCFGFVIAFVTTVFPEQQFLLMPVMADFVRMRWMLLANCCLAFALNLSIALFIKCSSAVSFVVAAIVKDVSIVLFSVICMGKKTTVLQTVGFSFQIILVLTWSLVKTFPKEFEHDMIEGFRIVFLGHSFDPDRHEKVPETYGAIKEGERLKEGLGRARAGEEA